MRPFIIIAIAAVVVALRLALHRRFSSRRRTHKRRPIFSLSSLLGDAGQVAAREVRERVRGRVFRVGTVIIFLAVAAAIVIPVLRRGPEPIEGVGEVGTPSVSLHRAVVATAKSIGIKVVLVKEPNLGAARRDLVSGRIVVAIVDGHELVVNKPIESSDTSTTARFVHALADVLGLQSGYQAAGLTQAQMDQLAHIHALRIVSLQRPTQGAARTTSVIGVILIFVMLTQYNTWILFGVLEEKSSRVVEVLLATVRPLELLAGKVLGIGLVALGQAIALVGFSLVLAKAVGSDLLQGTAPVELASALVWLVLGYALYCWVYAAAASTAERQDQVQSLVFPLTLPILLGYILALTAAGSGNATLFFKVLAYVPFTAPFAMPVLVGLGQVTWWQFMMSIVISVLCTVGVARLAGSVYRRAILQTGQRVPLRSLVSRSVR